MSKCHATMTDNLNQPSKPLDIPSNPHTPDPDPEDFTLPIQSNPSPSFDYHEERRLHLKDEIWLSHHLPRLPPPTLTSISTSHKSGESDPSPSAFHPHSMGQVDLDEGSSSHLQNGGSSMSMSSNTTDVNPTANGKYNPPPPPVPPPKTSRHQSRQSSMLSPAPMGDMDPAASLIHRRELDEQERLDLEEEKRERGISAMKGDLGDAGKDILADDLEGDRIDTMKGVEKGEWEVFSALSCVDHNSCIWNFTNSSGRASLVGRM